jgi:2Fe-2S ferredoxin
MAKLTFHFEDKSLPDQTFDFKKGESILDIALEEDIPLHHNCGGVCGCSTCHIYVNKGMDNLQEISDREEDFIDRAINPKIVSRLACQCVLQEETDSIEITVPDQSGLIGS